MKRFSGQWRKINAQLEAYVHVAGDNPDTVLHKKIWWLLNCGALPVLLGSILLMGTSLGKGVFFFNILFMLSMLLPLFVFHFYRNNISRYALFSQLALVLLASIKVYIMGGMVNVGTPVYVGLIGPIYALTLPNKRRAIAIFLLYTFCIIMATLTNPMDAEPYIFYRYFMGFLISNTAIFFTLYYFTSQWEKAKEAEKNRIKEIDDLKTKFYTHIAHEFRTPLSIISGVADQIKIDPGQWLDRGQEMIKRNTENLISLTNQLLDLAKLEDKSMPLKLVHDDVVLYLRYLTESFHSMAEIKGITLNFTSAVDEFYMDLDPDKLRDVLSNLLSNALKFTPESGKVSVLLDTIDKEGKPYLKLCVKDSGIGIPTEEQPLVFDRYFQAKNHLESHSSGSGLGLSLTQELVRLMEGEIKLQSSPGKGSAFEVYLAVTHNAKPVSLPGLDGIHIRTNPEVEDYQPLPRDHKRADGLLTILLVEDNADVVRYLHSLLEGDYLIEIARNGAEGYQKALECIPDLIISDVMMPEMDGYTLSKKIKADLRTSHIPIVLLTARSDFDSRLEGLKSGADAYLSKPFNRKELYIRINTLIALRQGLQARYALLADQKILRQTSGDEKHLREDEFMNNVKEVLEVHLSDEEFGISQLCEALAMSRSQLYRKFAALTDMSVNQFIITLRLEKAKELLATSELNVSEVAYDTGFKNPAHFSRVFSHKFGYPPSQLRADSSL